MFSFKFESLSVVNKISYFFLFNKFPKIFQLSKIENLNLFSLWLVVPIVVSLHSIQILSEDQLNAILKVVSSNGSKRNPQIRT